MFSVTLQDAPAVGRKSQIVEFQGSQRKSVPSSSPYAYRKAFPLLRANYRKHELVARDLEREFGHERVQGAHIERDGKPRPERTASHKEHQQGERTGISAKDAKEHITRLWRSTDNGKAFAEALKESGWILAQGDRRDFVVIDPRGGTHSLARRIDGGKAADVRERLSDIDRGQLPRVAEARAMQRQERQKPRETERAKAPPKPARAPERAREAPRGREGSNLAGGVARAAGSAVGRAGDALFKLLLGETSSSPEASSKPPAATREAAAKAEEAARNTHRESLLRDYGREVPESTERDAKLERDRQERDRGRERER